jgi:cyanoexosortase B-associated protein
MSLLKFKKTVSIPHVITIALLIGAIAIAAIPGYLSGKWSWADLPQVTGIERLKVMQTEGLSLPGWQTIKQQEVLIGGNQWSYQRLEKEGKDPVELLLMPQDYYKNHPQVEWTDIDGIERWKKDSNKTLSWTTAGGNVNAILFRAWKDKTFAVVQWYAWPKGGHHSSLQWFISDLRSQLNRRRTPWVAVCLRIPIEPLKGIELTEDYARSLAQTVQITLDKEVFRSEK